MDKLFGGIDYVEARESETGKEGKESAAYITAANGIELTEKAEKGHVEVIESEKKEKEK